MAITRRDVLAGAAALLAGRPSLAHAQDYPHRLIRILTGFPPGGNADAVARILAEQLEKTLGQTVIVEAKPGASGSLAAEAVARSAPDGYTLLAVPNVHPMHGALSTHLRYKVIDDFTWISTATFFPYVICVRADSKIETLRQLIDAAQSRPGALNYGGGQIGTGMHMVVELIASRSAASFTRIFYRGENDAIVALLAGEVDFVAATAGPITARIAASQVRALAVTGKTRWQGLPDVQTVTEAGLSGFDVTGWMGLAGPAHLPPAVVDRLSAAVRNAVAVPEVRSRLEAMGGTAQALAPADMQALVAHQFATWKDLGLRANLTID
jgi:tripartite-type tricarboxylate transporter receptor subunit TctC